MAEIDWADLTGTALGTGDLMRGVSAGFLVPNGGGAFVYGLRALTTNAGVGGKYCNVVNFKPFLGTKKGGSVTLAMKRLTSGLTYAPFFGIMKGTDPAASDGYFVALTQESSFKIGLFKGVSATGFSASGANLLPGCSSTATYTDVGDTADAWFHLRLDVLVNPHAEVVLDVYKNDLSLHAVTAPTWAVIPGMATFIDDSLGYWSDSVPYLDTFYAVYGMYTDGGLGEACLFDQITVERQLTP